MAHRHPTMPELEVVLPRFTWYTYIFSLWISKCALHVQANKSEYQTTPDSINIKQAKAYCTWLYFSLSFTVPGPVRDFQITGLDTDNIQISFRVPESPNGLILAYLVSIAGTKPVSQSQDRGCLLTWVFPLQLLLVCFSMLTDLVVLHCLKSSYIWYQWDGIEHRNFGRVQVYIWSSQKIQWRQHLKKGNIFGEPDNFLGCCSLTPEVPSPNCTWSQSTQVPTVCLIVGWHNQNERI